MFICNHQADCPFYLDLASDIVIWETQSKLKLMLLQDNEILRKCQVILSYSEKLMIS